MQGWLSLMPCALLYFATTYEFEIQVFMPDGKGGDLPLKGATVQVRTWPGRDILVRSATSGGDGIVKLKFDRNPSEETYIIVRPPSGTKGVSSFHDVVDVQKLITEHKGKVPIVLEKSILKR